MTNNDDQNKNPIKENLKQQFQELGSEIKLPEDLKEETFNTIDSFNLLGDFLDLFTSKFSLSEIEFLDILENNTKSDENESE